MAFDSLSEKLQNVFKNLRGKGRLTEADVKAGLKEVKLALLEAGCKFQSSKAVHQSGGGKGSRYGRAGKPDTGADRHQDCK